MTKENLLKKAYKIYADSTQLERITSKKDYGELTEKASTDGKYTINISFSSKYPKDARTTEYSKEMEDMLNKMEDTFLNTMKRFKGEKV